MQKEIRLAQNWSSVKNPQFLSNQAEVQAISPTHELIILTKFHKAGAALARVRGVRPNPSISREGFSNPSILGSIQYKLLILAQ